MKDKEYQVQAAGLKGKIQVISSKSHVHRLLICAALCEEDTRILGASMSKDIEATMGCLSGYGTQFVREGKNILVIPGKIRREASGSQQKEIPLDCGESGSTIRFLLPVCGALGIPGAFTGQGRLAQRPLSPLYELMEEHGCRLSQQGIFPLHCSGKLTGGEYSIAGNVSSQFISGLLFALPLLEEDSHLVITGELQSYPYIRMTLDAVRTFGIEIREISSREYVIPGRQVYRSPEICRAEGDWSNGAFWLAAGALGDSDICCYNLNRESLQGDKAVWELLKQFGACCEEQEDGGLRVRPGKLKGMAIDASQIPDLVPILSVCAAAAEGTTVIYGAERLRLKESDRLQTVSCLLKAMGVSVEEKPDGLVIEGKGSQTGSLSDEPVRIDSFNDHRIAMAAAVSALAAGRKICIQDPMAVSKSYPGFYEDYEALGGTCIK